MKVIQEDAITPTLKAVTKVSRTSAFETFSKIGAKAKKNVDAKMRSTSHNWHQRLRGGKLVPYYSKSVQKTTGDRVDREGKPASPRSMSLGVHSFMMEKTGTLVVGGRHKKTTVVIRDKGKIVGSEHLGAIYPHIQSIVHKLDTGQRVYKGKEGTIYHGWGKYGIDKKSMAGDSLTAGLRGKSFRGAGFMKKAFSATEPYMAKMLNGGYNDIVKISMDLEKIKPIKKEK